MRLLLKKVICNSNIMTVDTTVEVPTVEVTPEEPSCEERIDNLTKQLSQVITLCKTMVVENKQLKRDWMKVNKELKKRTKRKNKQSGGVKQLSGFAKPTAISPELAKFLCVNTSDLLARTDVTKRINVYIKEHDLQNPKNRRIIVPDSKLSKLLKNEGNEVTYFNLQRYMKIHFPKN
jgi:chromatin remodeling complex protein RSC6